jgi:oligopeptide/dipeptide ABC transporter ATP-binding protein
MYAGKIVEMGSYPGIFLHPRHPYTAGLLRSAFSPVEEKRFWGIPGTPPSPHNYPPGCRFFPRCGYAKPECQETIPWFQDGESGALCLRAGELELPGIKGMEEPSFWENIQE